MNPEFARLIEALEPKFQTLMAMAPVNYKTLPQDLPKRAVYLLSEGMRHLYVGRTNHLRQRLRGHCVPSSSQHSATFAFLLARNETDRTKRSYSQSGSRAGLLRDEVFAGAFREAKLRVADMDLRFVEEQDPRSQALLEIYAATALATPCNDFDNH
jgi:hypothetical protein